MEAVMSNVPELRFKEFEGEWQAQKLSSLVASIDSGWSPDCESRPAHPNEWGVLKTTSTTWSGYDENENKKLPDSLVARPNIEVQDNDILITRAGPVNRVGVVALVCSTRPKLMLSDKLIRIRSNKQAHPPFLSRSISGTRVQKYLAARKSGLAEAQANISQDILRKALVHLPPTKIEQQKIADFLTAVDTKIEQLTRKEELLKQYKKGVMQKIFSQEIRFKAEDGSEFPDWEYLNGDKLFQPISNKDHNSDLPVLAITQEHGAIPRDLIDYQISVTEKSVSTYKVVEVGDFIISLRSFQGGIEYSDYKGICSPAYIILRKTRSLNDRFYKAFLKTDRYIKLMNMKIEGIRDGKMISFKQFSEVKLPLPCSEEQGKIANLFLAIDEKLKIASSQLESAKTFKKGLLQQMFV